MAEKFHRATLSRNFLKTITRTKNPDEMISAAGGALEKTLNAWDLIILGVGVIIGSGIFAIAGIAAAGNGVTPGAGPALIISMIIAAIACIFSALCYTEFATMPRGWLAGYQFSVTASVLLQLRVPGQIILSNS